jgi:hypothetical protein
MHIYVSLFFNSLSNRLRITNYCLRSVSSSLLKFTRFIQGNNITWTNLDMIRNLQHLIRSPISIKHYLLIVMSYRSSLHFIPVQWFLAELWPLAFKFCQIFSCHHFISLWFETLSASEHTIILGDFNVNCNTTPSLYEKVVQHFKTYDL